MTRRVSLFLFVMLCLAAPASGGGIVGKKQAVDTQIANLHDRISQAKAREAVLSGQIASVTGRIRGLEARVGNVSARVSLLEQDLALHRARLDKLAALYRLETQRYFYLRAEYTLAVRRLDQRLIDIYESNDPSTVEVLFSSRSFQDLLDQVDFLKEVTAQDKAIAHAVGNAKAEVRSARAHTSVIKIHVAAETQVIAVRTSEETGLRDQLLLSQHALSGARARKAHELAATQESERAFVGEVDALAAVSNQLTAQIQAAQRADAARAAAAPAPASSGGGAPSASGLIWPVNGPVTSPFGMRWGRMHTGIDIGVPTGTPIHAAAAGSVIYAGWEGGYGNLVVLDHGNGLATAYAHQSSIAVSNGQSVAQGQVIGYVGCTGHCFGPHLHFEVRVNGQPVDPLGYI